MLTTIWSVPKCSIDLREHRDDLVFLADVGFDRDRAPPQALDLMRHVLGIGGIGDVVDDHVGARPRESNRNRLADTGIRAGDQGGLSGQRHRIGHVRHG